ncbi:MAG: hypothetical protein P4L10_07910, partial [Acidobacteriaceae bacterium]|nr:hypothetical protein [Acidobacteriaceae bacterium]
MWGARPPTPFWFKKLVKIFGKKGVVKDAKVHKQVLEKVLSQAENVGFQVLGLDFSPIRGPE